MQEPSNLMINEDGILIDASFRHPVYISQVGGVERVWNSKKMEDQYHFCFLMMAKTYKK